MAVSKVQTAIGSCKAFWPRFGTPIVAASR
jgi:hypothetical protein